MSTAPVALVGESRAASSRDASRGLDAFATELATAIGAAVLIDNGSRLLAYHVPTTCMPDTAAVEAIVRRAPLDLASATQWQPAAVPGWKFGRLPGALAFHRAQPVPVSVTAWSSSSGLLTSPVLARTLRAIASTLSVLDEVAGSARETSLRKLLEGSGRDVDLQVLDLPLRGARVVLAQSENANAELTRRTVRDWQGLVSTFDAHGRLVTVVRDMPARAGEDRGLRTARAVAAQLHRQQPRLPVGISTRIQTETDLPAAAADALDAARLAARQDVAVKCVDECWAEITVERLRRGTAHYLPVDHPLRLLADYDRRRGADLARTVAEWLVRGLDTAATAAAMSVHPNTLRYRLRRAEEVSGLDLGDSWQRLVTQLVVTQLSPMTSSEASS